MPLYMDRHYIEGITKDAITQAHALDLAIQERYPVKFLTYWFAALYRKLPNRIP
jgi:hypothetical protein